MIDQTAILQARRTLGRQLADHRQAAGLRQEELATLVHYGRSSVANIETGRQKGSRPFWQRCDEILNTDGALLAAHEATEASIQQQRERASRSASSAGEEDETMKRRHVIVDLGLVGLSAPFAAVEAMRHRL